MSTEPKINVPRKTIFCICNEASINNRQLANNISVIKRGFFLLHVQRNSGFWHILYFGLHSFTPQALRKQWKRDYGLKGKESCMKIVGLDTRSHNTPLYAEKY